MEKQDNVYAETTQSEATLIGNAGQESAPATASTELGKFRDVNALLRAYEQLEAEFTRRSQRLKELEKQADNFTLLQAEEGVRRGESGAEKLRKNAAARRAQEREFDGFVSELESAGAQAENTPSDEQETRAISKSPEDNVAEQNRSGASPTGADQDLANDANPSVAEKRESVALDGEALYELVSRDENVRLKIIGEYLSSIGKSGAPLMQGGGGTLVAPPAKARTIEDAGNMALRFFKKERA